MHPNSPRLPGDDAAEYQALVRSLTAEYGPAEGLTELRALSEMATAEWRLRRARRHAQHLLTKKIAELAAATPDRDPVELQIEAHESLLASNAYFRQLVRDERRFEQQYHRNYRILTLHGADARRARAELAEARWKEYVLSPLPGESEAPEPQIENRTNEANRPRNAPCFCGSGFKYKRCCGRYYPGHGTQAA